MMPIGPLMIERRLIERMFATIAFHAEAMRREGRVDSVFVCEPVEI